MSLARMFLRMLAVKALSGQTLAQDRVRDSDVSNLTSLMTDEPAPMIVVYTDDQTDAFDGKKDLYVPGGHILLTIQISIAGATAGAVGPDNTVVATAPGEAEGDATTSFYVPSTSAGLEAMIDVIEAQIKAALTDKDNPWSQIWGDFVTGYRRGQSFRGASDEQGTRFAVRQFNLEVETRGEPTPGRPPTQTYARILAALIADDDAQYSGIVPLLRALIEGKPLSCVELQARQAGMSIRTANFLAFGDEQSWADAPRIQGIDIDDADGGESSSVDFADGKP